MQLPKIYANQSNKGSIDLTLSVNPLGCSPRVIRLLKQISMDDISSYPDQDGFLELLAKRLQVRKESILLGCGSEQLIKLIAQTILKPGNLALVERGSFALFSKECLLAGAMVKQVGLKEIKSLTPALVFIANPKTPTGELIGLDVLKKLIRCLPDTVFVIDEANGEFTEKSLIPESTQSENLIVLRTFSKVLGLAGLRIGVAVGSKRLIATLKDAQQPFPVSQIALQLAKAALSDTRFINLTKEFIAGERTFLRQELKRRGVETSNSVTNNLFLKTPAASLVVNELARRGVGVIDGSFFPGMEEPGFRISLKDRKTNVLFLQRLDETLIRLRNKNLRGLKEGL